MGLTAVAALCALVGGVTPADPVGSADVPTTTLYGEFDLLSPVSAVYEETELELRAELRLSLKARLKAKWRDVHVTADLGISGWRVSLVLFDWRPLPCLPALVDEVQEASYDAFSTLRTAVGVVRSLKNAKPGWTVGVDASGRIRSASAERPDPLWAVSATATLLFN